MNGVLQILNFNSKLTFVYLLIFTLKKKITKIRVSLPCIASLCKSITIRDDFPLCVERLEHKVLVE